MKNTMTALVFLVASNVCMADAVDVAVSHAISSVCYELYDGIGDNLSSSRALSGVTEAILLSTPDTIGILKSVSLQHQDYIYDHYSYEEMIGMCDVKFNGVK